MLWHGLNFDSIITALQDFSLHPLVSTYVPSKGQYIAL